MHECRTGACGPTLRRRTLLSGALAALTLGDSTVSFAAASTSARLVVLNITGGVDGMSLIVPYGEASLTQLRGALMPPPVGAAGGMLDLGGFYGLHPSMPNFYAMYQAGEAAAVHAVGNPESDRSHFQGQDYLQAGTPLLLSNGWVNRLASLLPSSPGMQTAVNMGLAIPLVVQGPVRMAGWSNSPFRPLTSAVSSLLPSLMAPDPLLGPAMQLTLTDQAAMAAAIAAGPACPSGLPSLASLAWVAGSLLAAASGPRIAVLETGGLDTHANQVERLAEDLPAIDLALAALKSSLGAAWSSTIVVTVTEFGRTVAVNGTGGTDHGTAFAMLLAGGAVAGGKIIANWPGIRPAQLFEGRDLMPTVDYRTVLGTILSDHMALSTSDLAIVFPNGPGGSLGGLVRA